MFDPGEPEVHRGYPYRWRLPWQGWSVRKAVATRAAKPSDVITLYGANFGPTNPALPSGRAVTALSPLVDTPLVTIGGANATVQFGGGLRT